jgi:type I restriction enzyme S subunit
MQWIAPSEKDAATDTLEKRLWDSADTLTPEFVYCLGRSDEFRANAIKSMSGATGRQRVQERCFEGYLIAQPSRTLLDRFSAIVGPSFRLIYKLHLQIKNLRRTRDLLLPRLLSGQINLTTS